MKKLAVLATVAVVLGVACTSGGGDDGSASDPSTADGPVESSPSDAPDSEILHIATLNVLHGIDPSICPPATDACAAPARLDFLFEEIEASGCPEIVGLQEIGPRQTELVPERLPDLCDGAYDLVFTPEGEPHNTLDQEMVLTSLPVLDESFIDLAGFPWGAQYVRVDSALGPVDVVTTHLASSSNNPGCDATNCPQPLCENGLETGTCQARELLAFLDGVPSPADLTVITGDLNQPVDHPRITTFLDAGFEDTWTQGGNPECDPATGEGCTCCVGTGGVLGDLGDPSQVYDSRIDFVLVRGTGSCTPRIDPSRTGPFAAEPAPEPVDGVVWASDHGGVQAAVACR
ncbi:MAG: endonuclease/exonuclease/phosphatase family protein [Acidimicrobiia bacterium]